MIDRAATRPARNHIWRRLVAASIVTAASFALLGAGPADARTVTGLNPVAGLDAVTANTNRTATVTGWVLNPPRTQALAHAYVYLDGSSKAVEVAPTLGRRDIKKLYPAAPLKTGIRYVTHQLAPGKHTVCITAVMLGPAPTRRSATLCRTVGIAKPTALNPRIAAYAKTFVDKYKYTDGGRTPATGFDCSGLTSYIYAHFGINTAPQVGKAYPTAQAQYEHFRPETRAKALPGDLVFFHRGNTVFHVGTYLGDNMMVAAATAGYPMRYQAIWSTAVTFGTVTHK